MGNLTAVDRSSKDYPQVHLLVQKGLLRNRLGRQHLGGCSIREGDLRHSLSHFGWFCL